jgi:hypothetical protein
MDISEFKNKLETIASIIEGNIASQPPGSMTRTRWAGRYSCHVSSAYLPNDAARRKPSSLRTGPPRLISQGRTLSARDRVKTRAIARRCAIPFSSCSAGRPARRPIRSGSRRGISGIGATSARRSRVDRPALPSVGDGSWALLVCSRSKIQRRSRRMRRACAVARIAILRALPYRAAAPHPDRADAG